MAIAAKIETFANAQKLAVTAPAGFDAPGIAAILGALNTHYSGLSAPNQAAVAALVAAPPGGSAETINVGNYAAHWVVAEPTKVSATIQAANLATVAAAIVTALGAGYTTTTVAYTGD